MRISERTDAVPGASAEGNVAEGMPPIGRHEALRFELVWLREVFRVHVHVLYADDDRAPTRQHHIRCNEIAETSRGCSCRCHIAVAPETATLNLHRSTHKVHKTVGSKAIY